MHIQFSSREKNPVDQYVGFRRSVYCTSGCTSAWHGQSWWLTRGLVPPGRLGWGARLLTLTAELEQGGNVGSGRGQIAPSFPVRLLPLYSRPWIVNVSFVFMASIWLECRKVPEAVPVSSAGSRERQATPTLPPPLPQSPPFSPF